MIQLVKVDSVCLKGATIPLTDQHPGLVHHWQIPVLYSPFRVEGCLLQRAYQKEKQENYLIVSGFRNADLLSAYPMISAHTKRT